MDDFIPQYNQAPTPTGISDGDKKKRILLIVGMAVVVILIGILIYVLVFKKPSPVLTPGETFPIGGNSQTSEQPINNTGASNTKPSVGVTGSSELQKLTELYKGPVAGYTLLPNGRTIRLFDRTLGRLIEVNVNSGETRTMSDQPILGIHDAIFLGNNKIILRALDELGVIKSILYTIKETTNENSPLILDAPTALADDIAEIASSKDGSKAVFVIKDPLGANIDVLDTATQTLSRKGTLPISEWIPTITNDGSIYLSAKASRFAMSGTYKLVNKKLIISIPAGTAQTTTVAPGGEIAYSSGSYGGKFAATLNDTDILSPSESIDVPVITVAEKCTWSDSGDSLYCGVPSTRGDAFPDDWYLGIRRFTDSLHKYNLDTNTDEFLVNPELYKTQIDIVNIMISSNSVFLKNRTNEHLWMYRLTTQTGNTTPNASSTTSQESL